MDTLIRTRAIGNWGEGRVPTLLKKAGFHSIQDLNSIRPNHPGGDFLAERRGKRYFITVKARNKFRQGSQQLNGGYNIYPQKVRAAAREYNAIPSWLTIQLDTGTGCFSAYFGTIASLPNPDAVAVPMSVHVVSAYECLASNKADRAITPDLSNQFTETPTGPAAGETGKANHRNKSTGIYSRRITPSTLGASTMASFKDHLSYADPKIRPVLEEVRARISRLSFRVKEKVTPAQRIAYSVARVFAEVKVQKTKVLVRVFDVGIPDPRGIVATIPGTHKWQHQKEIPIDSLELVEYAMPFIVASYKSPLTTTPP